MRPSSLADEWLMAQVAGGRREALDTLIRRHASSLLTFITRMVVDRGRSEELFQEVFLAVWVKRRQFDAGRRFKPWLYGIAINACRAAFRRRSLPVVYADPDGPLAAVAGSTRQPADEAIATETHCLVLAAVLELPEQQRIVLVLRTWLELPYGEIAEILGCGEVTARTHMHHALAALREQLESRI